MRRFVILLLLVIALALAGCVSITTLAGPAAMSTPVPIDVSQTATPMPTLVPYEATMAGQMVARTLRRQLHLEDERVTVATLEEVTWPDACLGVHATGVACAQVVTPGYRIVLQADGQRYEYRTDLSAEQVVLASAPRVEVSDAAVVWTGESGGACQTAILGSEVVAFGACGGALIGGSYVAPGRAEAFAHFTQAYAPFETETPAGRVAFTGRGSSKAKPAEQRMIAEWARLAALEADDGHGALTNGLALRWRREGGSAGQCDVVTVHVTGEAYVSECKDSQPQTIDRDRLNLSQLRQLYAWVDAFQSFDVEHREPVGLTPLTVHTVFVGMGQVKPTVTDRREMMHFAVLLYTQIVGTDEIVWLPYHSAAGHFAIRYPGRYVFYRDEKPSPDGVVAPAPGTIAVHKDSGITFVLSIEYTSLDEALSARSFAERDDPCIAGAAEATTLALDDLDAVMFPDTPCGPYGSTVVYLTHGLLGYRITVESANAFQMIDDLVLPILETFTIVE